MAFKATLEELGDADLLLHVVDISNENYNEQMEAVDSILNSLKLHEIPRLVVFNKADALDSEKRDSIQKNGAILVSANTREGLSDLLNLIETELWQNKVTKRIAS
jgi:GTP-binding protein HflX